MAQGDIYTIDVILVNSSQKVSIVNDSIVLNAIVTFRIYTRGNTHYGSIALLNSNGKIIDGLFYKQSDTTQDWESIELPIKKLKLNAGDQLQFKAAGSSGRTYLNARITLMEV